MNAATALVERTFNVPYLPLERDFDVLIDGLVVSHVSAGRRTIVVDGRVLTTGTIGWVCTDPRWRRAGLATSLLRAAHAWMRELGLTHSALFTGVPEVYEPLGYRPRANPPGRGFMVLDFGEWPSLDWSYDAAIDIGGLEW